MSRAFILTACVALSLGAACAPRSQPVVLKAAVSEREALTGSWRGSYQIDRHRGGVISFISSPVRIMHTATC